MNRNVSARSSPNNNVGFTIEATLIAFTLHHRDIALLAMRTDVGVEQDFAVAAQLRITMRTASVIELEVPDIPAFWTTIMRNDLDLPIDDVPVGRRVTARSIGLLA